MPFTLNNMDEFVEWMFTDAEQNTATLSGIESMATIESL